MLCKRIIISEMQSLAIQLKEIIDCDKPIIISASGAMVLHGLRDYANDIDVHVHPDVFNILKERMYELHSGAICIVHKSLNENTSAVEVVKFGDYEIGVYSRHCSACEFESIDGVNYFTLRQLLEEKLALNRSKDQKDIRLLKARLANV